MTVEEAKQKVNPLQRVSRTAEFWRRSSGIYFAYKAAQARAFALRSQGWDQVRLKEDFWSPHHAWAGAEMYSLCVQLRGFYLKAGQFIGARGDFVPEPICKALSLLHDQVPPMSPEQTKQLIERELGGTPVEDVFEWLDLYEPLGSASISQVHKGKLRRRQLPKHLQQQGENPLRRLVVKAGSQANKLFGVTYGDVAEAVEDGRLAVEEQPGGRYLSAAALAAAQACESKDGPEEGVVAVKVQYPDASETMKVDLRNLRLAAAYLQKTELKFDLVSAIDELNKQIKLEFDFEREARIMDRIADNLKRASDRVAVPRSVPGLVSQRLLVMNFIQGDQITRLKGRMAGLSEFKKREAARRILAHVSEAYGRMVLQEGLFQADGHPGNILVMKGGRIALLDYGQSKQLPDDIRLAFAQLILALDKGHAEDISEQMWKLGVSTKQNDPHIRSDMAYGIFDTRGKVDPFDPNSPIKKSAVDKFPQDLFFLLRVTQLLRGLANGMGVHDFSSATQWRPYAEEALGIKPRAPLRKRIWPCYWLKRKN